MWQDVEPYSKKNLIFFLNIARGGLTILSHDHGCMYSLINKVQMKRGERESVCVVKRLIRHQMVDRRILVDEMFQGGWCCRVMPLSLGEDKCIRDEVQ